VLSIEIRYMSGRGIAALVLLASLLGCNAEPLDPRPSVVLVVLDTVRRDAVSHYGAVEGTTPVFDALAADGLVYSRALAASSWTLPSHASLFTSRPIEVHRVGMPGRTSLPKGLLTLAERLRADGYDTLGVSENMLVSDDFGMLRGFDAKAFPRIVKLERAPGITVDVMVYVDVAEAIGRWLDQRDASRPFFVFVNLFEAHAPYEVRERNAWVPEATPDAMLERRRAAPERSICDALPLSDELTALRGLYLGDVHAADEALGRVLEQLRPHAGPGGLISVVTSDHGELFGERSLLGHEFTLHGGVLDIPLLVHGLADVPAAEIDTPVSLLDVAPSILRWAGSERSPEIAGRPLPESAASLPHVSRQIVAAYSDLSVARGESWLNVVGATSKDELRRGCGPSYPVRGGMAALVEYPYKLHWFEQYPAELYDLSWDPAEHSDLAPNQPDRVARLSAELEPFLRKSRILESVADGEGPSQAELRALRELGYIE